jgi:hypothetical protein
MQLSKHAAASSSLAEARVCERVVVFSKRDLVPEWGIEVWKILTSLPFDTMAYGVAYVSTALREGYGRKIP